MRCRNCGSAIPEGVAFCQQCGTPVSAPLPPTVAASQPPYGNQNAHTNYNPSSMPGSGQTYETTQNPYDNNAYNPYAPSQPQLNNVPLYPPPPQPNNMSSYGPPQPNNASYGMGMPAFAAPVPVKPKSKVGLISGIVIAILAIVLVGGAVLIVPKLLHTTATSGNSTGPSGIAVDSTAASIVTNAQTAKAINTDTYQPTQLATSFKTYTDIYITFQFDFTNTDVSQKNPGYVDVKYYIQNSRILTDTPLKIDDSVAPDGHGYGYFKVQYYRATTAGAAELYWCRQSNCSDGKLAQTTTFTVTA